MSTSELRRLRRPCRLQADVRRRVVRRRPAILQSKAMIQSSSTVLVTGISGNLGTRLLPMLSGFRVIGVDMRPADFTFPVEFHPMNLGHEASCRELTQL